MTAGHTDRDTLRLVQAALDHVDQGFTVFDSDLRLVGWNKRFFEFLEFPIELGREGMHFSEFMRHNAERGEYGPGDVEELVAQRVARAREFRPHYLERHRPNGQIVAVRGEPLPSGGFVTTYTDITEERHRQKILEKAVAEQTSALKASEQRLRLITDAIPALIACIDQRPSYTFANRRYAEWFGHTPQSILGKHVDDVLGEELSGELVPHIARALGGEDVTYEYSRTAPDGTIATMRSSLIPDRDARGDIQGCFVLSLDITEQREQEIALRQAQKMEAVGQLTSGIVHDFNNMLTVIIGNLRHLERTVADQNLISETVAPSLQAAQKSADLTGKLLAFTRARALRPRAVDVPKLLSAMAVILRRTLPSSIEFVLQTHDVPGPAFVDANELENALLNLVLNARDAINGKGTIAVATRQVDLSGQPAIALDLAPGSYIRVSVTDNGSGMSEAVVARALEPFFTTKPPGKGSGLGLSAAYGFARQSGGAITFDTDPAHGTTVSLLLPRAADNALPDDTATVTDTDTPSPIANVNGDLVLLVEDDAEVRAVIRRQLIELGYAVVEASDGKTALNLLDAIDDLRYLLSDIVMPGDIDGVALARTAKERAPEIRVALISGYIGQNSVRKPEDVPFPVLEKPFQLEALAGLMLRAM